MHQDGSLTDLPFKSLEGMLLIFGPTPLVVLPEEVV